MLKQLILTNWYFMRVLRLLAGIALLISAFINHESLIGFFGLFFLYQGLFNINACGLGGCYGGSCGMPNNDTNNNNEFSTTNLDVEAIEAIEVKEK